MSTEINRLLTVEDALTHRTTDDSARVRISRIENSRVRNHVESNRTVVCVSFVPHGAKPRGSHPSYTSAYHVRLAAARATQLSHIRGTLLPLPRQLRSMEERVDNLLKINARL